MNSLRNILCIGTTPAAQRVMVFSSLKINSVNRAVQTLDGIAGKSVNVAKVLKTLGERPVAVGFLGGPRGEAIRSEFRARGIEEHFTMVTPPTRECTTVIDLDQRQHTELVEESQPVEPAAFDLLLATIRKLTPNCCAVIMSGTVVPGAPPGFYRYCTELAREAGALTVVDAQGAALLDALPAQPGLVKPNRPELSASVGRPLASEAQVMDAMRELRERGAQCLVVTSGPQPALAFDGSTFWRITPPVIEVRNPIGSGDSFTAALVARLTKGDDLGEACRWGTAAGAANALSLTPGDLQPEDVTFLLSKIQSQRIA